MAINIARIVWNAMIVGIFIIGAILGSLLATELRAQNLDTMNVMRIRLDTVTIQPNDRDIFVTAYYTFHAVKPHNVHGFNLHFFFDSTKTRVLQYIFDGTATASLSDFSNTHPPEAAVVLLGSDEIDLANPILFKIWFSRAQNLVDSESLRWDHYLSETSRSTLGYMGIDTIILDDGLIRVQQPKVAVSISTPSITTGSDSSVNVPVIISDLSGANIRQARIGFVFDTSVFKFMGTVATEPGVSVESVGVTGDSVRIDLLASVPMRGADSIVTLAFNAIHRTDTLCTSFTTGSFVALNSDALLGNVQITFDKLCVQGKRPVSVVSENDVQALKLDVFPNPARKEVHIRISGADLEDRFTIAIFNVLGDEIFQKNATACDWKPSAGSVNGIYKTIATDLKNGVRMVKNIVLAY